MNHLRELWTDESAAALTEYSVILAFLSMLSIASLTLVAAAAETTLENTYTKFQALQESAPQ